MRRVAEVPQDLMRVGEAEASPATPLVPTPVELERKLELPKVFARIEAVEKELYNLEHALRGMEIPGTHDLLVARQYVGNVAVDVEAFMNPEVPS